MTSDSESPFLPDGRRWLWSANSLDLAQTCARKYFYASVEGWIPVEESVHLTFGSIFSHACEQYHVLRSTEDHETSLRSVVTTALIDSWGKLDADTLRDMRGSARYKTRENLIRTIIWYLDEYENDPCETHILRDGKPAAELTFQFQIDDEIWLRGKMDRICRYAGDYYVQDQKTTGSTVGSFYFKKFNPDTQMSLYSLAAQVMWAQPVSGVMIDAVQIAVGFTRMERDFTFRTELQLKEWLEHTKYHIHQIWNAAAQGYPMNDSACDKYGGCQYRDICARDPRVRDDFLKTSFVKTTYSPLEIR